jgi:ribonuclease III
MSADLEKALGYRFKNKELLYTALTHKSALEGARRDRDDNEKLEFLGDSVIGLMITEYLYRSFRGHEEGELSKLKAHLVSSNYLFKVARKLDLGQYIQLGRGEEKNNGRANKKIVSSALEALAGAIFLDSNLKTVASVLIGHFEELGDTLQGKDTRVNDYKSALQELVQKHQRDLPDYRVLALVGKPPDTHFTVGVFLDNIEIGRGRGRSKREAEQEAALKALRQIGDLAEFEQLSNVFFAKTE